jgi:hypothetical protein
MSAAWKCRLILIACIGLGAAVFWTGIGWGLPSRSIDKYLFGGRQPWTGEEILKLAGTAREDGRRGADVDVNPLGKSGQQIPLNTTDAQRAAILIRYRLYTYQPDEMITMMSLASMHPGRGDLDPKLYQYGGLWVYPVGVLLRLASLTGAIHLTTDLAWYLDHPEDFGRFYVVARLYVVAWGLVGVWAAFALVRRLTSGSCAAAAAAAGCYIFMPVVVNMAHEAKPHLPAAVIMLLAVLAAVRYVETGRARWWLLTSVLCGAAFGMVLSAWPVFVILPVMVLLRVQSWPARIGRSLAGGLIGGAVYLLTNPYVAINWFTNRDVLRSNFGNSLAMYEVGRWREGLANAAMLVGEGTSVVLAVFGLVAVMTFAVRAARTRLSLAPRGPQTPDTVASPPACGTGVSPVECGTGVSPVQCAPSSTGLLLAAPALLILVQFIALAAGKPGEYGRFAVLPDIGLAIAAIALVWRTMPAKSGRAVGGAVLVLMTALSGGLYLYGFQSDSRPVTSRLFAAERLQMLQSRGGSSLGVFAEPAPYALPPVDLFAWRIHLLPNHRTETWAERPQVVIRPPGLLADRDVGPLTGFQAWTAGSLPADPTPISWANKRFEFYISSQTQPATQDAQ